MNNTCSTCKFWEKTSPYKKGDGYCDRITFWETLAEIKVHVNDDSGLDARLLTNENFGCNQYEQKI